MTCTEDFGKFKTKIEHYWGMFNTARSREVEFDVQWISCGVYEMSYYRPRDAQPHYVIVAEDWYPPDTRISFTPEQFEKVAELYPSAPKYKRDECYKPFYENYNLDRGMFDSGLDTLFQAFKDPREDIEKVYMVQHCFSQGAPTTDTSVLGLYMEDFNRLKEFLDSQKDKIFYSGCRFSSTGEPQAVWVTDKAPPLPPRE